jgi:hypothetical protein
VIRRLQELVLTFLSRSKARKILLVAIGLIIVPLAYWFQIGVPNSLPDSAEYHYERLKSLRANFYLPGTNDWRNSISGKGLVWMLNGKPTGEEQSEEMEIHTKALIELKFFEEKAFYFETTNRQKDLTELLMRNHERIWGCRMYNIEDKVRVIARSEDMPRIARTIREITAKKTP